MDNKISIDQPEIFTPDQEGFHPFKLIISKDEISSEQQLYFHKCLNTEYQEYSSIHQEEIEVINQSENNPQTIYFYNEETDRTVSQLEAKREEVSSESQAQDNKTLYFINEEESEP